MEESFLDKIPYFPTPYPDELLYSILGRYHHLSCNLNYEHTSKDLFGQLVQPSVELPSALKHLALKIDNPFISLQRLINHHTMFPLYGPFISDKRRKKLYRIMALGKKAGNPLLVAGIIQTAIKAPRFLKYCPLCTTDDELAYGESYWHRSQQPFGVEICEKHQTWLEESTISVTEQRDRWGYHPLTSVSMNHLISLPKDWANVDHYLTLSRSVHWILNNPLLPELRTLRSRYIELLKRRGLATFSGHVKTLELKKCIRSHYGPIFLEKMRSPVDPYKDESWVADILSDSNRGAHPIRHLLLWGFLGLESPDLLLQENHLKSLPFGKGPWPCLNPAAAHYRKAVIRECKLSRSDRTKGPVGTFFCDCGFIYSRVGPDDDLNSKYRADHIFEYGHVWKAELRRLTEVEKLSLKEIGRRLRICQHTIRKYLNEIRGQQVLFETEKVEDENTKSSRYRNHLISLMELHPHISRAEIKKMPGSGYSWLIRNDKQWLYQHLPKQKTTVNFHSRVNWARRDEELLKEIHLVADKIRSLPGKPVRITIKEIARNMSMKGLSNKFFSKLPKTKAEIERVIESLEDYHFRRVHHATEEIVREKRSLRSWRIIAKAGLNGRVSPRISAEIDRIVEKYHSADSYTQLALFISQPTQKNQ